MSIKGKALATGLTVVTLTAGIWIWKSSLASSCDPYTLFVKAGDIHPLQYYRFDGSTRPLSGFAEGHYIDSAGADHSHAYVMDCGAGKMELPTASGALGPDGYPSTTYPGLPCDVLVENQPPPPNDNISVCDKYRLSNGPHAKPCPSGKTLAQYSVDISHMPQWIPPGSSCGHFPTPTPTGGIPPSPSATPIPSKTPTPVVPSPTPTICIPKIITVVVTATRTPHIGPAPTKTP